MTLTEAELTNLIVACNTSAMRNGSPEWQTTLNAIATKLLAERNRLDAEPAKKSA